MKLFYLLLISLVTLSFGTPTFAAANFSLSGTTNNLKVGQNFSVQVKVTAQEAIDTARIVLNFPSNLVQAQAVVLNGPLGSASPGNSINNTGGQLSWGGFSVDNPLTGTANFARVTFRALAPGQGSLMVASNSRLIANGEEKNNFGGIITLALNIIPASPGETDLGSKDVELTSPTHPDQNSWYNLSEVKFQWQVKGDTKSVSIAFDQNETTESETETKDTEKTYSKIKDGIWYFHLKVAFADGREVLRHYRVQIDTQPPKLFEPYLEIDENKKLTLQFATTDDLSGVGTYLLQTNGGSFVKVTSPHILQGLAKGENNLIVRASDAAGNSVDGWIKFIINDDGSITEISKSHSPKTCNLGMWPIASSLFCQNLLLWHILGYLILIALVWLLYRLGRRYRLI